MNKRATKYGVCWLLSQWRRFWRCGRREMTKASLKSTYIAQWAVPRAQWPDMVKLDDQERPLMEKMVADGSILD
jgi:hypothetical protein